MDSLTQLRVNKWRAQWLVRKAIRTIRSDRSGPGVPDIPEARFEDILASYDEPAVFVHVGLSDVKTAFGGNPYEFLLEKLTESFDTVMGTGYTPSFRSSGVYHKAFSKPEFGTFSKLFLDDADYRTDDAIHSILVKGDYRFHDCDHHDSFGADGCRGKLDDDNVLCLNVGTNEFVCPVLHYLEDICDLPYVEHPEYEGVIYHDETEFERVTQRNYTYTNDLVGFQWNAAKIRRTLESAGVLRDHSIGGLRIYAYRFSDAKAVLLPLLEDDPYYLVT